MLLSKGYTKTSLTSPPNTMPEVAHHERWRIWRSLKKAPSAVIDPKSILPPFFESIQSWSLTFYYLFDRLRFSFFSFCFGQF